MNTISKKKIMVLFLISVLILAGLILLFMKGFQKDIIYQPGTRIEIYFPKGYNGQEVLGIAKECFANREIALVEVEKLGQVAGIKLKDYTEEEFNNFKKKIQDKYVLDENELQVEEVTITTTRISSLVEPYILPASLITILTLVYVFIRNLKEKNKWKILCKTIFIIAIPLACYFSILLILRLPFTTYTLPITFAIYLITICCLKVKEL